MRRRGPRGATRRLYGPPGLAYVYLNYGIHYLVNAVTEPEGWPAAVLIRALEPLDGETLMRRRRARGTGRAASALATTTCVAAPATSRVRSGSRSRQNLRDLAGSTLRIEDRGGADRPVAWGPRIGIRVGIEHPWRCVAVDSAAVSGRRTAVAVPRDDASPRRSALG